MNYALILTNIGRTKIAAALADNTRINLLQIAYGDGNGEIYEPNYGALTLAREVYRADIINKKLYPSDNTIIVLDAVIPFDIGGFTIREVGIIDADNELIALSAHPEIYKPLPSENSASEMKTNIKMRVANASAINLEMPSSVVFATMDYVDDTKNEIRLDIQTAKTEFGEAIDGAYTALSVINDNKLDNENIDTDILTDIIYSNSDGSFTTTLNKYNPVTEVSSETIIISPLADEEHDGVMSKNDVKALQNHASRIAALEGASKRYPVHLGGNELTQEEYQVAYEEVAGVDAGTIPPDGATLVNLDNNHAITYFANNTLWIDRGVDTISQADNDGTMGGITGSLDDGQVYIENDGKGSVNGWYALKTNVLNLLNSVANKVAKIVSPNKIYGTDASGNDTAYDIASQAEAIAGTANDKIMTPLRTEQTIAANIHKNPLIVHADQSSVENAYAVTDERFPNPLPNGFEFTFIPNVDAVSNSAITLCINGATTKQIRRKYSNNSVSTSGTYIFSIIKANVPIKLKLVGDNFIPIGYPKLTASDIDGVVPVSAGGTGKNTISKNKVLVGNASGEYEEKDYKIDITDNFVLANKVASFNAKAKFGEQIEFIRDSIASYVDADTGLITEAQSGQIRVEKDGMLFEVQSSNLCLYSENQNSGWIATNGTITSGQNAPDGTNSAILLQADNTNNNHAFNMQGGVTTVGATYTYSVFVKAGDTPSGQVTIRTGGNVASGNFLSLEYNPQTQAILANSASITRSSITPYANGWNRVEFTFTADAEVGNYIRVFINGNTSNQNTNTLFWGGQIEALPFATSYVKTLETPIVRKSDVLRQPFTTLNAPNNGMTIITRFKINGINPQLEGANDRQNILNIAGYSFILLFVEGGNLLAQFKNNSVKTIKTNIEPNVYYTVVIVLEGTNKKVYLNGDLTLEYQDSVFSIPDSALLYVGNSSNQATRQLNGHIEYFNVYDKPLNYQEAIIKSATINNFIRDDYYNTRFFACVTNTGNLPEKIVEGFPADTTPQEGDFLRLTFNAASSAASPTLNINGTIYPMHRHLGGNLISGTEYGFSANQTVMLNFTNGAWKFFYLPDWIDTDVTTNTNYGNYNFVAGEQITKYKLVMEGLDGKAYPLCVGDTINPTKTTSAQIFSLGSPVYYWKSATNIDANNKINSELNYTYYKNDSNVLYIFNGFNPSDLNKRLYLVGTVEGGGFKLDQTSHTSWYTTTKPTSEDGKVYKPFGVLGDNVNMFMLDNQGVFMQYRNGIFAPYSAFSHNIANDYTADEKTKLSRVPNTVLSNIGLSEYTDSQIGISRAFTMLNDNTGEQTNAFYLNSATTTTAGVMTAADKAKLSKVNGNVYYATTATAATTTTKVVEGLPEGYVPVKGDTLYLKWNVANSVASPTLSINGAVYPLQFRTANLTSAIQYSIPINQITMLVYTNTSWEFPYLVDWIDNDTISNTNIGINTLISGEVTTQYKLVMKALDGKLYPLCIGDTTNPTKTVSAQAFDLSSPVFWKISTSSTAAGDKIGTALYYEYAYNNANVQYAFNGFTSADFNKQLYLVGTIEGGGFRLDNSSATSWYTTAIPTSEDGKAYKPFGFIGDAANQFNLVNTGELFEFKNGVFAPVCGSGNIPTYNTIPTNKKEELIFVVGIGFMEWNTAVSPNAYVKNLVLTTSDLNSFANGGSVKLTANAIRDVTITSPIYPVFREVGLLNGQVSGIVGMGEVRSIVTDINPAANYIFARSGQIKLRFKIERRGSGTLRNVTIYKNDTSIYSGNTNGTYDINVTFVKGDRLRFSYSSTAGIVPYLTEFMPYASLDSIAEGAICTPTKQIYKYTIVVTPYDGGGA